MGNADTTPAAEYLKRPYARVLVPDTETGTYTAQIVEFQGCIAQGDSPGKAYKRLEEVAQDWIAAARDQGQVIPEPSVTVGYSGKIALRLPRSLHRQASQLAEIERVSLNQFIVSAVAEKVGAVTATNACIGMLRELAVQRSLQVSVTANFAVFQNTTPGTLPDLAPLALASRATNAGRVESSGLRSLGGR